MKRIGFLVLLLVSGSGNASAQANCTRTLGADRYDDSAYSETSMSYNWINGDQPDWFDDTVAMWNKCSNGPSMSTGGGGDQAWNVRFSSVVPELPGDGSSKLWRHGFLLTHHLLVHHSKRATQAQVRRLQLNATA